MSMNGTVVARSESPLAASCKLRINRDAIVTEMLLEVDQFSLLEMWDTEYTRASKFGETCGHKNLWIETTHKSHPLEKQGRDTNITCLEEW
jgi:hypothetical protein